MKKLLFVFMFTMLVFILPTFSQHITGSSIGNSDRVMLKQNKQGKTTILIQTSQQTPPSSNNPQYVGNAEPEKNIQPQPNITTNQRQRLYGTNHSNNCENNNTDAKKEHQSPQENNDPTLPANR